MNRNIRTLNEIIKYEDYAEIILYNRQCKEISKSKINLNDIDKIKNYKWGLSGKYSVTAINRKTIYLHRLLLGIKIKKGLDIDHINGKGLDNRRCNLRICTRSQNCMNRKKALGITWDKNRNKWAVYVWVNYKRISLGRFENKKEALDARRQGELKYFKKFAK